jgi:aminoglycoside phosphotransferase (APT) family kinase protein
MPARWPQAGHDSEGIAGPLMKAVESAIVSDLAEVGRIADRWLPGTGKPSVQAMRHGGTSVVFRVARSDTVLYVRLAEDSGEEMAVEAAVHDRLRRCGVRLPEVVGVEPAQEPLGRGALVLSEMPGTPLTEARTDSPEALREVAAEAGRDLARIASVPVQGFGFISRDNYPPLAAPMPSAAELLLGPAMDALARLTPSSLDECLAHAAASLIADNSDLLDAADSRLAHGDLDATHVYTANGCYTGIIDFGEMRGAPTLYDAATTRFTSSNLEWKPFQACSTDTARLPTCHPNQSAIPPC